MANQNPEQMARDAIDAMLAASGWIVQLRKSQNRQAGLGVAMREYQNKGSLSEYALFVGRRPVTEHIDKNERLKRKKFWEIVDEEIEYSGKQLNNDIMNSSSIRTVM